MYSSTCSDSFVLSIHRTSAEKKCEKAVKKLEQALSSHNEELQGLREQLETQLDLNSKCNCRVYTNPYYSGLTVIMINNPLAINYSLIINGQN